MDFAPIPGFEEDEEPPRQDEAAKGKPNGAGKANGHAAWPEPIDILADQGLTGVAQVDETCLPPCILDLAQAEGARLQVDPCGIASLGIGACSAMLSDDWRVRLKINDQGWIERPCIWVCNVAESGRKKSDQFSPGLRFIETPVCR
jgi:hypothetical protein